MAGVAIRILLMDTFPFRMTTRHVRTTIGRAMRSSVIGVRTQRTSSEGGLTVDIPTVRVAVSVWIWCLLAWIVGVRSGDGHSVVPVTFIEVVVTADITWHLGAFKFVSVSS